MFSNWVYILVGDNNTGKTSFQRYLVEALCGVKFTRLPRNVIKPITHLRAPKKLETLFTANRSYQEKSNEYKTPGNYVDKFVGDADIVVLSSHSHGAAISDIRVMLERLTARSYNVAGVFWSNDFGPDARRISSDLPWQERLWVENPPLADAAKIQNQIRTQAFEFAEILVERARFQ